MRLDPNEFYIVRTLLDEVYKQVNSAEKRTPAVYEDDKSMVSLSCLILS